LAGRPVRRGIRLESSRKGVPAQQFENKSNRRQHEKVERRHQKDAYHKADGQPGKGQAEVDYSPGLGRDQGNDEYAQPRRAQQHSPNARGPEYKSQDNPGGAERHHGYKAELAKLAFFGIPVYLN